jgi:hypothetical protein
MTEALDPINALISVASLLGLWFLVFLLYRDYSVDKFRQEMFALRDSLFDEANRGLVPFSHPSYGLLRSTMNGFIRFGHRLGFGQLLFASWMASDTDPNEMPNSFSKNWEASLDDLSPEQRDRLQYYFLRMNLLVVGHALLRSPIVLVTIVLPVALWLAVRLSTARFLRALSRPIDSIDSAAFANGQ